MAKKTPQVDETKLRAISLISQEVPVREIAQKLEVSYSKVLNWRKEFNDRKEAKSMEGIIDMPSVILERAAKTISDELTELSPESSDAIEGEIMNLAKSVDGYKALSTEFQNTASTIAKKIDLMILAGAGPSELVMLTESLCSLQQAFFSTNVVNVNVLNAPGAGGAFSGFKNSD